MKALVGVCDDVEEFPPGHCLDSAIGELRALLRAAPGATTTRVAGVARRPRRALREAFERRRAPPADERRAVRRAAVRRARLVAGRGVRGAVRAQAGSRTTTAPKPGGRACTRSRSGSTARPTSPRRRSPPMRSAPSTTSSATPSQEGLDALPDVIRHIETYDVTTIRASTPMYLMARRIQAMGVKMVLSGEGSDEIFGGYLYFHKAPDARELPRRDGAQARRAAHLRLPAREQVDGGLGRRGAGAVPRPGVPRRGDEHRRRSTRWPARQGRIEKHVLREAFEGALPHEILWRQKEQFCDGVGYGWIDGLKAHAEAQVSDASCRRRTRFPVNPPQTKEAYFYRRIFEELFPGEACGRCRAASRSPARRPRRSSGTPASRRPIRRGARWRGCTTTRWASARSGVAAQRVGPRRAGRGGPAVHPVVVARAPGGEPPLWPPGMWMMPSASWPGDTTMRSEAPMGRRRAASRCRRRVRRRACTAAVSPTAPRAPADGRSRRCCARPSGVAPAGRVSPVRRGLPRRILEQRIPILVAPRQQVRRTLCGQRPGHAFELRQVRRDVVLAQRDLRRRGQAVEDARVHRQPPGADDAVAHRLRRRAAFPGLRRIRQGGQCRRLRPCGPLAQQGMPALQEHGAIVELDREQIAFGEFRAGEQRSADLSCACAERLAAVADRRNASPSSVRLFAVHRRPEAGAARRGERSVAMRHGSHRASFAPASAASTRWVVEHVPSRAVIGPSRRHAMRPSRSASSRFWVGMPTRSAMASACTMSPAFGRSTRPRFSDSRQVRRPAQCQRMAIGQSVQQRSPCGFPDIEIDRLATGDRDALAIRAPRARNRLPAPSFAQRRLQLPVLVDRRSCW